MFRLVSLIGIVALTVAAAALADASKSGNKKVQAQINDEADDLVARITPSRQTAIPSFHARFSLN